MRATPVLALGLVLVASGCSVVAPSEDELGGEYGAGRWCERQTGTLCADFDDQLFPMGWEVKVREAATLSIETKTFSSAPASLASVLLTSSTTNEARIGTAVPQSAQRTRISFDLRLAEPALVAGEDFTIVEFLCADTTGYDGPWLQFAEPEGLVLRPSLGSLVSADAFPFDRWVRVALDVRWGASVGIAQVLLEAHAAQRGQVQRDAGHRQGVVLADHVEAALQIGSDRTVESLDDADEASGDCGVDVSVEAAVDQTSDQERARARRQRRAALRFELCAGQGRAVDHAPIIA